MKYGNGKRRLLFAHAVPKAPAGLWPPANRALLSSLEADRVVENEHEAANGDDWSCR